MSMNDRVICDEIRSIRQLLKVGRVEAAGTSNQKLQFSYLDGSAKEAMERLGTLIREFDREFLREENYHERLQGDLQVFEAQPTARLGLSVVGESA